MFRIDRTLVNMERIEANIPREKPKDPVVEETPDEKTIKFNEERIAAYAKEIVDQATQKSRVIIKEAEEQALVIKSIARQKGYEEGLEEAGKKLERALEEALEEDRALLGRVISQLEQAKQDMLDSLEDDIINLTFAIIKKIFYQINEKDSSLLKSMITNALKQMKKEGEINIRVSKEEYDRFFSSGDASFVLEDSSVTVNILPDIHMNTGECIIQSDSETINAGFDSQLNNIESAFRQADGAVV